MQLATQGKADSSEPRETDASAPESGAGDGARPSQSEMPHDPTVHSEAVPDAQSTAKLTEPRFRRSSALVAFTWLAALLLTWVYVLHQIDRSYDRAVLRAELDTRHLASLFLAQVRGTLASADDLLLLLANGAESGSASARALIAGLRADGEPYARFSVIDASGTVVTSSDPTHTGDNVARSDYFVRARSSATPMLVVGKPVPEGPLAGGAPLARRVVLPDGQFGGVVEVVLSAAYLVRQFESVQLGGEGVVMLCDAEGAVYARRSAVSSGVESAGRTFDLTVIAHARKSGWGTYVDRSAIDAIERVVSFRTIERHKLIVTVGKSADDVLLEHAPLRVNWLYTGVVISLLLSMVGLLSVVFLRREQRSAKALVSAFELEHANARTDPLTQLPNRRAFLDIVTAQMEYHRRHREPLSVAYFDCDRFKEVNDRLGHDAGDRCLIEVAIALSRGLRRSDFACRIGGDEFAVLFPSTRAEDAAMVMERFRGRLGEQLAARQLPVTVSVGIVEFDELDAQPEELLTQADAMMYQAKRAGGNRIVQKRAGAGRAGGRRAGQDS